jgi:phosphonate transport system substrate-binding protein
MSGRSGSAGRLSKGEENNMRNDTAAPARLTRRQALRTGASLLGMGLLAACAAPAGLANAAELRPATPSLHGAAFQSDLNEMGWPTAINPIAVGVIPLEDAVVQKSKWQPFMDHISKSLGAPVELSITTSYAALVEAQRSQFVTVGYYGALSFLFAEQQIGAVPIAVDSSDGMKQNGYYALLLAGKDSPVKTVQDIRGQDFTFVDPGSTSGYLFPSVMLIEEGIDPKADIKARFAGNHANSILAVAKGQAPCGASNNLSVNSAIRNGSIAADELVILKESDQIPNGPYTVSPDFDPRAKAKLIEVMTSFTDAEALKAMEHGGPLIPAQTEMYDFVRRSAKAVNLTFDEKGGAKF